MKKLQTLLMLILALVGLSNCEKTTLDNQEAQKLIESTIGLPIGYGDGIYEIYNTYGRGPNFHGYVPGNKIDVFKQDGLIDSYERSDTNNGDLYLNITILEKGKPYYMGMDQNGCHKFYTYDIEFNQIEGISFNKENLTATIRFSIKATNITPFASSLRRINQINIKDTPISGEFIFKKFDTGWQLETNQNKTSQELLELILGKNYGTYFTYNPANKQIKSDSNASKQQANQNSKEEDLFSGAWHGHETYIEIKLISRGTYEIKMMAEGIEYKYIGLLENDKLKYTDKDFNGNEVAHYFIKSGSNCIKDGLYKYCRYGDENQASQMHHNFSEFWIDFKKAIINNDKQAITEMTKFPFIDFNEIAYNRTGLGCSNSNEFQEKLSQIFPSCATNLFMNSIPEKIDNENWSEAEKNMSASHCLFMSSDCSSSILGYTFGLDNGTYKLLGLKYMP